MTTQKQEPRETGAVDPQAIPEGSQANPADVGVPEGQKNQVAREPFDPQAIPEGSERNPADVAAEKAQKARDAEEKKLEAEAAKESADKK